MPHRSGRPPKSAPTSGSCDSRSSIGPVARRVSLLLLPGRRPGVRLLVVAMVGLTLPKMVGLALVAMLVSSPGDRDAALHSALVGRCREFTGWRFPQTAADLVPRLSIAPWLYWW